jgi:hypothetical protein
MGRFYFIRINFVHLFAIWYYSDYVAKVPGNKTCELLTLFYVYEHEILCYMLMDRPILIHFLMEKLDNMACQFIQIFSMSYLLLL